PLAELGVEAGGELEATGDRSAQMRYTGALPMAIGFRCFEVKIDRQGRLELENTDVGGPVFFSDDDDAPQGALLVEDDWLDL
ncbi:MAG: hypothetical protein H6741_28835, partial [Alphaproteobacteria bacterium]|nr:hypothetical protein [Alphaproteobacteria bacterium]